jgi:hypothetical protein
VSEWASLLVVWAQKTSSDIAGILSSRCVLRMEYLTYNDDWASNAQAYHQLEVR